MRRRRGEEQRGEERKQTKRRNKKRGGDKEKREGKEISKQGDRTQEGRRHKETR